MSQIPPSNLGMIRNEKIRGKQKWGKKVQERSGMCVCDEEHYGNGIIREKEERKA